jgi:hypothetical protein
MTHTLLLVCKMIVAQRSDPDMQLPQRRLHDVRIQLPKPCRPCTFSLDGIGAGDIEVPGRYGGPPSGCL